MQRRTFLQMVGAAGVSAVAANVLAQTPSGEGTFEGTLSLSRPNATPLERLLRSGLDARLFTDLSRLNETTLTTPSDRFYVRTAQPAAARLVRDWRVDIVHGRNVRRVAAATLQNDAAPQGEWLLECSGNGDPDNFGLLSSAHWSGVPMPRLLAAAGAEGPPPRYVLVGGMDDESSASGTSVPGASWVFRIEDLREVFLATHMNGVLLPPDHGAPVRLIVPGWYGCACIKWVNRIEVVSGDAAATPQMREFAARTHQPASVAQARDFQPATIDHAAIPVRVERWRRGGAVSYRIVGIIWGGARPTNALMITFEPEGGAPVRVTNCPLPASTRTWALWSHEWTPPGPGRYTIAMSIADRTLRTRRLDLGFYQRSVVVPAE